jgi:hypothetical protein
VQVKPPSRGYGANKLDPGDFAELGGALATALDRLRRLRTKNLGRILVLQESLDPEHAPATAIDAGGAGG